MKKHILFLLTFVVISSCGRKNTFVSRNWHEFTAKYNVLYNGELALEDGINQLNDGYEEDVFVRLKVEPILIQDSLKEKNSLTKAAEASFFKAEEKAVKAVQKHSIQDYGVEQNAKMDEAYLLLGKARYYDGRMVPAQESFDYAIRNNPIASLIDEMRIWRAKSSIRLENEAQAIRRMKRLVKEDDLKDGILAEGHTALALGYESYDSIEPLKKHLKLAFEAGGDPTQAARNRFLRAQLLIEQDSLQIAQSELETLAFGRKTPKKYQSLSLLTMSRFIRDTVSTANYLERVNALLKDQYYNNEFARLYFAKGILLDSAEFYTRSKSHPSSDFYLQQRALSALGDDSFKKGEMLLAGKYFDSILSNFESYNTLYLLRLNRKRENLEELIVLEEEIHRSDSIMNLWSMNDDQRYAYFVAEAKKQGKQRSKTQNSVGGKQSAWYFDNPQVVAAGQKQFEQTWGNIINEDDWKFQKSSSRIRSNNEDNEDLDANLRAAQMQAELLDEQIHRDSLNLVLQEALYVSALQYFEVYNQPEVALSRLERLADKNPVEVTYYLYQIHEALGNEKDQQVHAERLINNYPDHPYTLSIQGVAIEDSSVLTDQEVYQKWYLEFEQGCYDELIVYVEENLEKIDDKQIILKFELLRSLSVWKMFGDEEGIISMQKLIETYPNSKEAEYLNQLITKLKITP
ncbi:MAG: tetratricopeptide repeat protein [Flavobacteriaceae bacterium]